MEDRVAIVDLADDLGEHKAWLFKIAKSLKINKIMRRDLDRSGQSVATVSLADAEAIRRVVQEKRQDARPGKGDEDDRDMALGHFYVIRLEPELDPGRIKLGFTTELEGRIRKHRTVAPFAIYEKSWPCRRSWERTAMDGATFDLEKLHVEVFRAESLDAVIARIDKFFDSMPVLISERPPLDD